MRYWHIWTAGRFVLCVVFLFCWCSYMGGSHIWGFRVGVCVRFPKWFALSTSICGGKGYALVVEWE